MWRLVCAGVLLGGCSEPTTEKYQPLMGLVGFALGELQFERDGGMHAVDVATGRVLDYEPTWHKWAPAPAFVANEPPTGPRMLWDVNGHVYVSANVIYQASRRSLDWALVPDSVGKKFVAADPEGNLYALAETTVVLPAGASRWVPTSAITALDPQGRPYAGAQRLKGAALETDPLLASTPTFVWDVDGKVLQFMRDGDKARITRHEFGSSEVETLGSFDLKEGRAYELLGCGTNARCVLLVDEFDVYQLESGEETPRHIGNLQVTSALDDLNFSGYRLSVTPDGRLVVSDVSGQGIDYSRAFQLVPGTRPFPGDAVSP